MSGGDDRSVHILCLKAYVCVICVNIDLPGIKNAHPILLTMNT